MFHMVWENSLWKTLLYIVDKVSETDELKGYLCYKTIFYYKVAFDV